jgi:hypothetical protein
MNACLPTPPHHIRVYLDILGEDLTFDFLMAFGGTEVFMSRSPQRSRLVEVLGQEKAQALADYAAEHGLPARVPLARPWVAQMLFARGLSKTQIARRLHVTDRAVRDYLAAATGKHDPRQTSLF